MSGKIDGIKLIYQTGGVSVPDDPTYPWKLEGNFSPPKFMEFAFIGLHGSSEEIIVRGMTQEALEEFITKNDLRTHPRLRRLTITGPDGEVVKIDR